MTTESSFPTDSTRKALKRLLIRLAVFLLLSGGMLCTTLGLVILVYLPTLPWKFLLLIGTVLILSGAWLGLRHKLWGCFLTVGLLGIILLPLMVTGLLRLLFADPITLANSQRITPGMLASEVEAMLGPPDKFNGSEDYVETSWHGGDGEILVAFKVPPGTANYSARQLESSWTVTSVGWAPLPHLGRREWQRGRLKAWQQRYWPSEED